MPREELPKLPYGQGTFAYKGDKIEFKKVLVDYEGNKHRKTVVRDSVKECMREMERLSKELLKKQLQQKNEPLQEAMLGWAESYKEPTLKEQSYTRLESTIRNQIGNSSIGHRRYQSITTDQINQTISEMISDGLSYSTIKKAYDALNEFYRTKSRLDNFENPMELAVLPTKKNVSAKEKDIVFFEQADIDKFIQEAEETYLNGNPKYKYGYILAANIYLGLRIGELLAIQWQDVDLDKSTIYVSKTLIERNNKKYDKKNPEKMKELGIKRVEFVIQKSTKKSKNRYVPINSKAKELILKHREISPFTEQDDYVISTSNRKTNTIKNMADVINIMTQNAGMKVVTASTHVLRHTCASLYFRNGVPIETICKILGNTREVCEKTYVHFIEEQLKQAAEQQIQVIEI